MGVITLSRDCTPTPWVAAGALATGSSLSSLDVDLVGLWVELVCSTARVWPPAKLSP